MRIEDLFCSSLKRAMFVEKTKFEKEPAPAEVDCYLTWRLSVKILRDVHKAEHPKL